MTYAFLGFVSGGLGLNHLSLFGFAGVSTEAFLGARISIREKWGLFNRDREKESN